MLLVKDRKGFVLPVLISGVVGTGTVFLLMLLFAFITVKTGNMDMGLFMPVNIVSLCTGAFIGGWLCAKIIREKGFIWGMVTSAAIFLITSVVVIAFGGEVSLQLILKLAAMLPSGAIGGILGVSKRKKRRYQR